MSEICLDCWNKMNGTNDKPKKYILSKDLDLCEDCGEYKHVIIMYRSAYYRRKFRYIIFPFRVLYYVLFLPFICCRNLYLINKNMKPIRKKN